MLFCQIEMSQKHDKLMQYEIIKKSNSLWMCVCMYVYFMYVYFIYDEIIKPNTFTFATFSCKETFRKPNYWKCRRNMQSFLKLNAFAS